MLASARNYTEENLFLTRPTHVKPFEISNEGLNVSHVNYNSFFLMRNDFVTSIEKNPYKFHIFFTKLPKNVF